MRGALVHGDPKIGRESDIWRATQDGKAALRDTIRRFLSDPKLRSGPKLNADFWLDRLIGEES